MSDEVKNAGTKGYVVLFIIVFLLLFVILVVSIYRANMSFVPVVQ